MISPRKLGHSLCIEKIGGNSMTIFKVFFQEDKSEVIIRENTQVKYFDAVSEEQVRRYLSDRPYNIEFVQPLEGAHLEYEKESPAFNVETI